MWTLPANFGDVFKIFSFFLVFENFAHEKNVVMQKPKVAAQAAAQQVQKAQDDAKAAPENTQKAQEDMKQKMEARCGVSSQSPR